MHAFNLHFILTGEIKRPFNTATIAISAIVKWTEKGICMGTYSISQ